MKKEASSEYNFICPNCEYEFGDCWEWPEEGNEECYECKTKFNYQKEISVMYCTEEILE